MRITGKTLKILALTSLICASIVWSQAEAAGLDGSTPIICALTKAFWCDSEMGCEATTPEYLGLPRFIRVDISNKKIVPAGIVKEGINTETPIKNFQRLDDQLVLQGLEIRGWNMIITESTGKLTLTASGDDEAFVLFGACMVP
jgi:hypothetical protein